ncbi:hypothetical protein PAXRUDRAFT_691972 [Paxillus rubicundulus Ve08.2h10]|uniref:Uncharacterized protein n=1 Tax=Paxillus rubicundulus Ve08.2h10 TaxID=930991 RepID=A0A0D0DM18_9AGAM|nr:hypothetical protein PAXRUDRAFT_691972 [Paxillus rubicundulus Ve08.2h10]
MPSTITTLAAVRSVELFRLASHPRGQHFVHVLDSLRHDYNFGPPEVCITPSHQCSHACMVTLPFRLRAVRCFPSSSVLVVVQHRLNTKKNSWSNSGSSYSRTTTTLQQRYSTVSQTKLHLTKAYHRRKILVMLQAGDQPVLFHLALRHQKSGLAP